MKIKVVHDECGREILVQQILETGGHCPWDGKSFNKDYTAVLAEALERAEAAGSVLDNALEKIVDIEPSFRIERRSILASLEGHLDRLNKLNNKRKGGR